MVSNIQVPELQKLDNDGHLSRDQINNQLITIEDALSGDIQATDIKMSDIQLYLTDLRTQLQQLKSLVANEKDPGKRANLFKIINNTLEIIATFEGLYLKALEVKFKYRQEFTNAIHRKVKLLEIDLKQSESVSELNKTQLLTIIGKLQSTFEKINNINNSIADENGELIENNEEFELTEAEEAIRKNLSNMDNNSKYSLR